MTRVSELPPEEIALKSWIERSSFILGEYADEHAATLEGFGLERPIERGTVRDFLAACDRRRRAEGHAARTDGFVGVPLPDGSVSTFLALPETVALVSAAQRIASELDCAPGRVVSFLLTGQAFALPWIEIETLWKDLGPSFVIHVGSADVTAEDVRQAYVAAVRAALGGEGTRTPPAHIYPLVRVEVEGRLVGLKWEDRWKGWKQYAHEWGITEYKTVESYRNYINKKKAQHEWIRRAIEQADAERLFKSTEKRRAGGIKQEGKS